MKRTVPFLVSAPSLPVKHPEISSGIFNLQLSNGSHSHPLDLRGQITELQKIYQNAWLTGYAGHCLETTPVRRDADYDYWRTNGGSLESFYSRVDYGEALCVMSSMPQGQYRY